MLQIEGNAVILYEERPAFQPPHQLAGDGRGEVHVRGTQRKWRLDRQHRETRWHAPPEGCPRPPASPRCSTNKQDDERVDVTKTLNCWGSGR